MAEARGRGQSSGALSDFPRNALKEYLVWNQPKRSLPTSWLVCGRPGWKSRPNDRSEGAQVPTRSSPRS
jgi:hypothetical protein